MHQEEARQVLIQHAREIVAALHREMYPIAGACIVSSVAAGDVTQASDVDMLVVAADGKGRPGIQRKLVDGTIYEWCVVPECCFADVGSILADAGLTHDVRTAIILKDETGFIAEAKKQVGLRYCEPEGIRRRTEDQLGRMGTAVASMCRRLDEHELLLAQRAHVSVLKAIFGIPRAVLNRRCTMSRGLAFCKEAAHDLGWSSYLQDALNVFGATHLDTNAVRTLHALSLAIVAASGFSEDEKAVRAKHLEASTWLLANEQPADAVWPLYFWSSSTVEEAGGTRSTAAWRAWQEMASLMSLASEHELRDKCELAQALHDRTAESIRARKAS